MDKPHIETNVQLLGLSWNFMPEIFYDWVIRHETTKLNKEKKLLTRIGEKVHGDKKGTDVDLADEDGVRTHYTAYCHELVGAAHSVNTIFKDDLVIEYKELIHVDRVEHDVEALVQDIEVVSAAAKNTHNRDQLHADLVQLAKDIRTVHDKLHRAVGYMEQQARNIRAMRFEQQRFTDDIMKMPFPIAVMTIRSFIRTSKRAQRQMAESMRLIARVERQAGVVADKVRKQTATAKDLDHFHDILHDADQVIRDFDNRVDNLFRMQMKIMRYVFLLSFRLIRMEEDEERIVHDVLVDRQGLEVETGKLVTDELHAAKEEFQHDERLQRQIRALENEGKHFEEEWAQLVAKLQHHAGEMR